MSVKALQDYTFTSKYARYLPELQRRETWNEAIDRVRDMHIRRYPEIKEEITWAFEQSRQKRVLGSQRALQFGGSAIEKKHSRIFNCIASYCDRQRFFQEALWLLLSGCGVGFSVQKHHIAKLPAFSKKCIGRLDAPESRTHVIVDSIEGWADSVGVLLSSFFGGGDFPEYEGFEVLFDYSQIRPEGAALGSSSGKAPGPKPLQRALDKAKDLIVSRIASGNERLKSIDAYDIVMHLSDAVLSGGVRRSATICLFSPDDEEMATAKIGNWFIDNPQRGRSNNSALLLRDKTTKEEFEKLMGYVREFGEPGFVWSDSTELVVNPCVEIGLYPVDVETGESGWEACVSAETTLLTKEGRVKIGKSIGKPIEIWNGKEWKTVTPFQTGSGRKLYRVKLSDGSHLDCTSNHKWLVKDRFQNKYTEVETKDLLSFSKYAISTPSTSFDWNGTVNEIQAYEYGFILGDGCAKRNDNKSGVRTPFATLFDYDHDLGLNCDVRKGHAPEGKYNVKNTNVVFNEVNAEFSHVLKYSDGLPSEVFNWDRNSCYEFIAGWMDSDGTKAGRGFRIYGRHDKLADLQLLLTKLGFMSSLNLMREAGVHTNYGESKQDVWYIQVSEVGDLKSRRINFNNYERAHAGKGTSQIIKYVVELEGLHDTFCVHEPDTNQCVFNNVLTKQCNLCEINGKKCKTPEDFEIACRAAAIIGTCQAGYSDLQYLGPVSKRIIEKEALLGVSITGMMDNPDILFDPALQRKMAHLILEINEDIAKKIGINPSARISAIKPAGTTSCILGTASGIHPHHAMRYIRRSQGNYLEAPLQHFKKTNPLAVERSVWNANGTDEVVAFCIEVPKGAKTKNDIDAKTLLEYVKLTQENWVLSGTRLERCTQPWLTHNVSNTITVHPEEWDLVTDFIYENRKFFCGISLLPISGDKDYPQAPFTAVHTPQEITKMYGDGSLMASGLIVDGLAAFDNNLWKACDAVLGRGELIAEPVFDIEAVTPIEQSKMIAAWQAKTDWIRRAKQFAERYFEDDVREMTFCLKDVSNWKYWCDLNREYKEVDYSQMVEEQDGTKQAAEWACSGGSCDIHYV